MTLDDFELTEEKVLKLKPIIEKILSRKYGKEITFADLTIGNITVGSKKGGGELNGTNVKPICN